MRIRVNGEPREVEPGLTLAGLLVRLGIPTARVAVAVNGRVIPRGDLPGTPLAEADEIEVITAVAGG
jgi:sulfur carrier protein